MRRPVPSKNALEIISVPDPGGLGRPTASYTPRGGRVVGIVAIDVHRHKYALYSPSGDYVGEYDEMPYHKLSRLN